MLPSWTIGLLLLATVRGKEICYEPFGCFSDEKPWTGTLQRPLKLFPWSPEDIDAHFLLYTNENPNNYQRINITDLATVKASNFQLDRKTRFVIHGFIDDGDSGWPTDMCKKMFKVEKVNCICVDWEHGAWTEYTQAVHNTRVVGAEIAFFVQGLSTELGYGPENVHLIGHSLGAQLAAEAGRRLGGQVGRITGLDPAQPCFEGTPEEVRLDPSDAMFVDVIHTDSASIIPFLRVQDFVACSHLRSYKYYSSSILNPDGFLGYPCASYEQFQEVGDIGGSLQPDASHMHDIDVDLNIGKVQKVKFLWNNNVINLFRPKLGASRITVQDTEQEPSSSYSWGPVSVAPKLSIISSGQSCPQCLAVSPVLVATTDKDHIQHPGSTLMEPAKTTLK
ncbi:hypothetical protein MJG53_018561 [Ovis ammon polii x Ovis aries]|uniref:Uncharacterized protein n=1 Tax=Ovis ammon polii x Ovis aries TaxID=2918886 RepID=A0ACB9U4T3_9CETA|nr:hypothetical protein MJG53_018561 [Ovis ammon polii x Ovis aries]